jgi:DNA-binding CsgD family transcriptional regulator
MRAASDAQLITAMRDGLPEAWAEFDARFRPLLETVARRARIPTAEWETCVADVLTDAAIRFSLPDTLLPENVPAYLVRSVRFRYFKVLRAARRRAQHYADAAMPQPNEPRVVREALSEGSLRASAGPMFLVDASGSETGGLTRFTVLLTRELSPRELHMLGWVAEGIPRRHIAEWLGVSYEAARKRITRLCRSLRLIAPSLLARLDEHDRSEVERFLRRVGALPPPRAGPDERTSA